MPDPTLIPGSKNGAIKSRVSEKAKSGPGQRYSPDRLPQDSSRPCIICLLSKAVATRANMLARKCPNVVSANDPEVIVKLRITLRQGKIKLARIRAFGHLENALADMLLIRRHYPLVSFAKITPDAVGFAIPEINLSVRPQL